MSKKLPVKILSITFFIILTSFSLLVIYSVFQRYEEKNPEEAVHIDWQQLYPFRETQSIPVSQKSPETYEHSFLEKISTKIGGKISYVKMKLQEWSTTRMNGYLTFAEMANRYESTIGWNFSPLSEYNGVVILPDGHLTSFVGSRDVNESVRSIVNLSVFCRNRNVNFLYVNAPYKVCKYEDRDISGSIDFSNQNADEFLKQIGAAGVEYYDLREALHAEGKNHHRAFFRTDHHWLPETGLWASRRILEFLRDTYYCPIDSSVLDENRFKSVKYPKSYLGSGGVKLTLARTTLEDITLFYPKYPTLLHYEIPELGIDRNGDFSVTYSMGEMARITTAYQVYNGANPGLIRIENELVKNRLKVLLLKDSFGQVLVSFLAMGLQHIDALDIRYDASMQRFNGSVQKFIDSEKPDVVIVLYNSGQIGTHIDWESHGSLWDFR